jgi:pSer/pThr/pTyr-binding forkhead associated (FHA) protein
MGSLTQAWIQLRSVTYPIQQNSTLRIGRAIGSDIRLFEDTAISREHCIIACLNQKLEVTDLDSRNGTLVNGKRISVPTQLHHRDVIDVGEAQLTILLELDPDDRNTDSDVPLMP